MKNYFIFCFIFCQLLTTALYAQTDRPDRAYDPNDNPLLDQRKVLDIYINAQEGCGLEANTMSSLINAKLIGQNKNNCVTTEPLVSENIRIKTNISIVDPTDMGRWSVYDHYGSNAGGIYANGSCTSTATGTGCTPPLHWTDSFGDLPVKRIYFAYNESNVDNSTGGVVTTIKDYVDRLPNMQTTAAYAVKNLDQHIYAAKNAQGNADMTFVGYGVNAYADYLFYPTQSTGNKKVNFTVNSSYVVTHSFAGAGFLINTGVDENTGDISGYLLYYAFSSSSAVSSITLYKINNNVTATSIHQNGFSGSVTPVSGAVVNNPSWNPIMDIELQITQNSLIVKHRVHGQPSYSEIMNCSLPNVLLYNGFGPFVQYTSHSCGNTSVYQFSDLKMQFADDASNVMDALSSTDYYLHSEKYFINLFCDTGGCLAFSPSDWEGIARLQQDTIRYITNVKNPFLNDGQCATTGTPLGNNGKTLIGSANSNALAQNIADYILQCNAWNGEDLPEPQLSNPVAMFSLISTSDTSGTEQVLKVQRKFISNTGLSIFTDDKSKPSYSATDEWQLIEWKYTMTDPSGASSVIVRNTPSNSTAALFTLTKNSLVGEYTVTLQVKDNSPSPSDTSNTILSSFIVITDDVSPVFNSPTPASGTTSNGPSFSFAATDNVKRGDFDFDLGVKAFEINYDTRIAGQSIRIGNKIYSNDSINAVDSTLTNEVSSLSINNFVLPEGKYTTILEVWDLAGNSSKRSFFVNIPFSVFDITYVLNGGTDLTFASLPTPTQYTVGIGAKLPINIYQDNNTFLGWFDNPGLSGTKKDSVTTTDAGNKTFYAKWMPSPVYDQTDTTTGITITSPPNTIPNNAKLVITDVTDAMKPLPSLTGEEYFVRVYKVELLLNGDPRCPIEPTGSINITFPLDDPNIAGNSFFATASMDDNKRLHFINSIDTQATKITFTTDTLGYYALLSATNVPDFVITHNLTPENGGYADKSGDVVVDFGQNVSLTITANPGYKILNIIVDSSYSCNDIVSNTYTYNFTNVTSNHTLDVTFVSETTILHTITAASGTDGLNGIGGTLTLNGDQHVITGSNATFQSTADKGYQVKQVLVDGVNIYNEPGYNTAFQYTYNNIRSDHRINLIFNNLYNIYYLLNGGYCLPKPALPAPTTYTGNVGAKLPQNIYKPHYTFVGWFDNFGKKDSVTVNEIGDKTFHAEYIESPIYDQTDTMTGITITAPPKTIPANAVLVITDVTDSMRPLPALTGEEQFVSVYKVQLLLNGDPNCPIEPTGDVTLTFPLDKPAFQGAQFFDLATMSINQNLNFLTSVNAPATEITITTKTLGMYAILTAPNVPNFTVTHHLNPRDGGYADKMGMIVADTGETVNLTITANPGYKIFNVTIDSLYDCTNVAGTLSYSYTFSNIQSNHTIDVTFIDEDTVIYTIAASAGTDGSNRIGGTIVLNGEHNVVSNENSVFHAHADRGYYITNVLVNGVNIYTPQGYDTVFQYYFNHVTSNQTISVVFNNKYKIIYYSEGNEKIGDVMVITDAVNSYIFGSVVILPAELYRPCCNFLGWYDNADFAGSPILQLSADTYGDINLYAKWDCMTTVEDLVNEDTYIVTPLAGRCWFRENSRATLYQNGQTIPFAKGYNSPFASDSIQNISDFGRLYDWNSILSTVNENQICPDGWRVPTTEEWNTLNQFVGDDLRSVDFWLQPNHNTNMTQFDSRPAGFYNGFTQRFENIYGYNGYWSNDTDSDNSDFMKGVVIQFGCETLQIELFRKTDGLSVRCIKVD